MKDDSKVSEARIKTKIFLFILLISNFFRNLGSSIVDIGLPHFILSLSGTLISYGLVVGIFSVTQSLLQFPIASASDRYGRKLMIGIGMSVYVIGTFLCFIAQTIPQLILFRAIQGAGAYSSILQAMTCEYFGKERQGKAMAFYSSSLSLGYFGGIVIGGYLSYFFNFRIIFLISGSLAMISMILICGFLKNPKKIKNLQSSETSEKYYISDFILQFKTLTKDRQFLITMLLNSVRWMFLSGSMVYMIWVLEIIWGFNEIETSFLILFIVFIYITSIISGGPLVDKFGTKRVLMLGQSIIIISGSLFFILIFSVNIIVFYIGCIFSGIGFAFYQTSGNSQISNVIEKKNPELRGSGFGLNNTLGFICGAMGPIILSSLGIISIFLPFYFITITIIIALLITFKFVKI